LWVLEPIIIDDVIVQKQFKRSANCTWKRARKKRDARSSSAPSLRIACHLQPPVSSGNFFSCSGSQVQRTIIHTFSACFRLVCLGTLQCIETVIAKYIFSKSNVLRLMNFSYKHFQQLCRDIRTESVDTTIFLIITIFTEI
jgi:hypothetical protein